MFDIVRANYDNINYIADQFYLTVKPHINHLTSETIWIQLGHTQAKHFVNLDLGLKKRHARIEAFAKKVSKGLRQAGEQNLINNRKRGITVYII